MRVLCLVLHRPKNIVKTLRITGMNKTNIEDLLSLGQVL